MDHFSDSQIEEFFANITPEHFTADTSFHSRPIPRHALFNGFVGEHLELLRVSFAGCDGALNPISAVTVGGRVHYFKAEDGETLGGFCDRVAAFAHIHCAQWLFIYKVIAAELAGEGTVSAVYWLAGNKESLDQVAYRHGYLEIEGQILGGCHEAPVDQVPTPFKNILEPSG